MKSLKVFVAIIILLLLIVIVLFIYTGIHKNGIEDTVIEYIRGNEYTQAVELMDEENRYVDESFISKLMSIIISRMYNTNSIEELDSEIELNNQIIDKAISWGYLDRLEELILEFDESSQYKKGIQVFINYQELLSKDFVLKYTNKMNSFDEVQPIYHGVILNGHYYNELSAEFDYELPIYIYRNDEVNLYDGEIVIGNDLVSYSYENKYGIKSDKIFFERCYELKSGGFTEVGTHADYEIYICENTSSPLNGLKVFSVFYDGEFIIGNTSNTLDSEDKYKKMKISEVITSQLGNVTLDTFNEEEQKHYMEIFNYARNINSKKYWESLIDNENIYGDIKFAYMFNAIDLKGKNCYDLFKIDDLIIATEARGEWTYFGGFPDNAEIVWFMDENEIHWFEFSSMDKQKEILKDYEKCIESLDYEYALTYGLMPQSIFGRLPKLKEAQSFGDIKTIIKEKLDSMDDNIYEYADFTIKYKVYNGKKSSDIQLYVRGDEQNYVYIFGNKYLNIYESIKGSDSFSIPTENMIDYDSNYSKIYTSNKLSGSPLDYRNDLNTLVKSKGWLELKSKEQVNEVGRFIINHIDYVSTNTYDAHTAAKGFYDGACVCEGYADLTCNIMEMLGIECYYVLAAKEGYSEGDTKHVYNVIKIDDEFAFYDFTWADQVTWIDYKYYDFDLDIHPYKPFYNDLILDVISD